MIKCGNGKVSIEGSRNEIINEAINVLIAMIDDDIIEPIEIMKIAEIVLEKEGMTVIKGTEEDLKEFIQNLDNELCKECDGECCCNDDYEDDDENDVDDIFGFLRGKK